MQQDMNRTFVSVHVDSVVVNVTVHVVVSVVIVSAMMVFAPVLNLAVVDSAVN